MASFAHVAPDGTEQPFSDADNQIIAEARARGLPTVRINDVVTSSGAVLQFEVRFGTAARSERMVQVPPTGMCQVNLINGNTRVVRELQLGDATLSPQASAPPAYRGPSSSVHRPPVANDETMGALSTAAQTSQPALVQAASVMAPVPPTVQQFQHVSPDGTEQPFSDADNQIIAEARARGLPTVRINDVVLPSGAVLQFEVRFGTAARSERMVQVPPTGMCQVNLINGNTRVVRELQLGDATLSPQASAPPAYRGPSPSVHRPPAPSHWQSSTRLVQPVGAPPVYHAPSLAPQATGPTYGHEGPDGTCTPFSDADNHAIASAITRGDSTIRTNDIVLPNGSILQFEVRFGAAAVSMRMPKPPASGMIQVNLANENTRVVRQIGGQPAKSAVTSVVPIDTAPSIRAPLGTAPSMPAPNLADERKKRDALAVLNGATKMLLCDPTGKSKHDRFFWVEEDPSSKARICWSAKSKDEHSVGGGMFSREVKVKKETLMSITSFVPVVDESSRGCAFQMGTDKTQLVVLAPDETTKETWVFGCQLVLKEEEAIRDRLERDRLAAQKASAAAAKQDADQMKSKARREMQKAKADADVAIADANAEAQNLAEAQRAMKAEAEESRQTLEQISNLRTLPPAVVLCKAHGVNPLLPQLSDELHRLVHQEVIVWGCECSHGWDVSGRSGTVGEIEPVQKGNIVVYLQPASDCSGGHHSGSGDGAGAPADSELVAKLQEMGFSQSHARAAAAAISRTGESVDQSVQNAMEWCLQHPDASDSMASITGHGEMIELPREQVIPARHEPVLLDAVKKALRNHFMARYIGPAAGGGLVLVDPKNCVVCGKVFRHLNDGVECTSDHFTCNTCLCRVASDSSGVVCCPVARAGCMAAPFDDVTIARHVDQTTFEALEARRQSVANAGGKWLTEPEDLGNGVYKYSLTHAGVGVSNSLDAHHFGLAFTQYGALLQSSAKKVTLVEYYENPGLRTKFEATRQRFELAGKDDKAVWIFHGSKKENIPKIMEGGFKVGGKKYNGKAFPVANGTAYGQGVYSATGPDTPMSYSRAGNQSIILAMALKGKFAPSKARGLDSWSNGSAGSDWLIFADDEQVLPVYVVHYQD